MFIVTGDGALMKLKSEKSVILNPPLMKTVEMHSHGFRLADVTATKVSLSGGKSIILPD